MTPARHRFERRHDRPLDRLVAAAGGMRSAAADLARTGVTPLRMRAVTLRRTTTTSTMIAVAAALSLTIVVPAYAVTLHHASAQATGVTADAQRAPGQAYSVPSSVTADYSVTRDDYGATSPAELAAAQAAAAEAAAEAASKTAAIAAILTAPVSVVTTNAVAASGAATSVTGGTTASSADSATAPDDDVAATATAATAATSTAPTGAAGATGTAADPASSVTVTTSGTLSSRLTAASLDTASATAVEIAADATAFVGLVPYVHGGADPKHGFDCSGLVMYVYAKFGISVPHDVDGIAALGTPITADQLQPGDLVVYPHQHIGIYIGAGYMVDAPNVGRDVEVQRVWGTPTYVHVDGA